MNASQPFYLKRFRYFFVAGGCLTKRFPPSVTGIRFRSKCFHFENRNTICSNEGSSTYLQFSISHTARVDGWLVGRYIRLIPWPKTTVVVSTCWERSAEWNVLRSEGSFDDYAKRPTFYGLTHRKMMFSKKDFFLPIFFFCIARYVGFRVGLVGLKYFD